MIRLEEENEEQHITDFNQEHRSILEQGINLLRYGFDEEQIREFMEAVRKEPEMAEFINQKMNTWGPGLEYEEKRVWSTAQPQRWIAYLTEERRTEEPTTHCADHSHDKGLGGETENRSGQNRWMNRKRTRKQCSKHHGARRLLHNDSPPSVR